MTADSTTTPATASQACCPLAAFGPDSGHATDCPVMQALLRLRTDLYAAQDAVRERGSGRARAERRLAQQARIVGLSGRIADLKRGTVNGCRAAAEWDARAKAAVEVALSMADHLADLEAGPFSGGGSCRHRHKTALAAIWCRAGAGAATPRH